MKSMILILEQTSLLWKNQRIFRESGIWGKLPLFTSCCPAWVKFCEQKYPELRANISTCRSPQQMFGAVLKEEARNNKKDTRKTVVVSIMPCTAKKAEILRPEHKTEGEQDVDFVLTTTEVIRMIKEAGIDLAQMPWEAMDMPFGLSSGARSYLWRIWRCDRSRPSPTCGRQWHGSIKRNQIYWNPGN